MPDLSDIADARSVVADLTAELRNLDVAAAGVASTLARARSRGDMAAAADAERAFSGLRSGRKRLADELVAAKIDLHDRVEDLARARSPDELVGDLDPAFPIAMLPVRLETRFFDQGDTLSVRIFPDQLHVTAHDPALTDMEVEGIRWYWSHRWPDRVTSDDEISRPNADRLAEEAWDGLASRMRPGRAGFLVRTHPPDNLEADEAEPRWSDLATRASAWSRAPVAALLPDRWCVLGFRIGADGEHERVFRKWAEHSIPDTLAAGPSPDAGEADTAGGLPDDPDLEWLHDPARAALVGMLVTVTQQDMERGHRLAEGIDRLVVIGVDWTLDPQAASDRVASHLAGQRDEGELAFVPQGAPTNMTNAGPSAFSTDPTAARVAHAPHGSTALVPGAGADLVSTALGLGADALAGVPGGHLREADIQGRLVDALWPVTGGYFLTEMLDPVADDPGLNSELRQHVAAHLRPGGPLPLLRVGAQPYGMLPIAARGMTPGPGRGERAVHRVSTVFRKLAEGQVSAVPRLGQVPDRDVEDVLLELFQRTPVSWSLNFRELIGPIQRSAMSTYWDQVARFQGNVTATIFAALECYRLTLLSELTHEDRSHAIRVPLVSRPEAPGVEPGTGYIGEVLELLQHPAGRSLLDGRQNAIALLEAMLAWSAVRSLDATAKRLTVDAADRVGVDSPLVAYAAQPAERIPYTIRVEEAPTFTSVTPTTPLEFASAVVPGLTGGATIAEHTTIRVADTWDRLAELVEIADAPLYPVARLATALRGLVDAPPDQLEWAFRGVMDLYATRLDAWITSLADARLTRLRRANATGVHIGAWGVVEDLRRDVGAAAESLGFIHAPSIGQAAALAVLRSARLTHTGDEGQLFDLDLTSERVREALQILEGVAAGQRLAALLGYRFERRLKARSLEFAQWILPLRRLCPLRSARPDDEPVEPVEAVAARDVVDGLALLDRWEREGPALLIAADVDPVHHPDVSAVLDEVAGLADAVSDCLMTESIYQATIGNLERSGAALAAHDRHARPPELEAVQTHRDGDVVGHRVGIWLPVGATDAAPGWPTDIRSGAEPRLDHWLGGVLGNPARWQVGGRLVPGPDPAGVERPPVELDPIGLNDLGLSAISLVLAAQQPGNDQPSELEVHVALVLGARAEAAGHQPGPQDQLELDMAALEPVRDLAGWAVELLGAQDLSPADLASIDDIGAGAPTEGATIDGGDATERATRTIQRVSDLLQALDRARADLESDPADPAKRDVVRRAISDMAPVVGIAALLSPDGDDGAPGHGEATELLASALGVHHRVENVRDAAAELLAAEPEATTADGLESFGGIAEHPEVVRARGVIRRLLGAGQPFLPLLEVSEAASLIASVDDRDALLRLDPDAAATWIHRMSLVRPALDPLAALLVHHEADGADVADELTVLQLPHRPGAPWVALRWGEDRLANDEPAAPPPGTTGIVLYAPDGIGSPAPLTGAGVLVDAWTENVPVAEQTTAVSFHYDAPGSRAPQTVLVAVPEDERPARWSADRLADVVNEAVDLARLRTLGSKELAGFATFLPALFLPDAYTRDVPGIRLSELLANVELVKAGGFIQDHVLGKAD